MKGGRYDSFLLHILSERSTFMKGLLWVISLLIDLLANTINNCIAQHRWLTI